MLGRSAQLEIRRQVVVHYLLFCLVVVAWLLASLVVVSRAALREHEESVFLTHLGRSATTATLEYLRQEEADLPSLVERFARERTLLYCAVVSPDGHYLAHSLRDHHGKRHTPPEGRRLHWGEIEAVRCTPSVGATFREYRVPLDAGGEPIGALLMAAPEPGFWAAVRVAVAHAPLALVTPFLFVGLGALVIGRMVLPLATIDAQLRKAAAAPTLADARLAPLAAQTPGALGWNRLIGQLREGSQEGALDRRLSDALQTLRQERSEDVLNSLPDGLAVTDSEGRIRFANPVLAALLAPESGPASLAGRTVEELLELPDDDPTLESLAKPQLRGRPLVHEVEFRREDSQQALRVARNPIRSADRAAVSGHVWSVRDVTQQRLAEKAQEQFLDSATHELRTPLANIRAYAETLASSEVLDVESQKQFCNTINAEATRLARFIDDLLSISSMEMGALSLNRQDVDLQRLFAEVTSKIKPQMDRKGITFTCVFPEKYPKLKGDKDKLIVVLVNLLGNAAKYTAGGGGVALKVQVTDSELRISVQDSGVGISPEELPRVFEKFFRSRNPDVRDQTGSGLGLSMAQNVILLHGGELTVDSELGVGSTFTATLPLK